MSDRPYGGVNETGTTRRRLLEGITADIGGRPRRSSPGSTGESPGLQESGPLQDLWRSLTQGHLRAPESTGPYRIEAGVPDGYPLRMSEELQEPVGIEREIQERMIARGAELVPDGYMGPLTIAALNEMFELEVGPGELVPGWVLQELGVQL